MGRSKKLTNQEEIALEATLELKPETVEQTLDTLKELNNMDSIDSTDVIPAITDPKWHDYIMGQFTDDELFKGNPTVDGLRRLTELNIGEIIESYPDVVEPTRFVQFGERVRLSPVTIRYHIRVKKFDGSILYSAEVADTSDMNTDLDYAKHGTSVAATKAEGRALRKLLKLRKIVCAEEVANSPNKEEVSMYDKINDTQINFIDVLCRNNGLNVMKFVNMGSKVYTNIKDVPFDTASKMVEHLSKLNTKAGAEGENLPEHIKGYDTEWKKKTVPNF